jgi:predicted MFS family arabinose efflux permease
MRAGGTSGTIRPKGRERRAGTFADVVRTPVFAVLFSAEVLSIAGDQLGRVALSVLVFVGTGSAAATAATYAATFLPAVLGGALLSRIGDAAPRRAVMIGVDSVRAGLFAVMAVSGLSLAVTVALLVVAVALGPVFTAAEVSVLSAAMGEERFRLATALRMSASQSAQVLGFVFGGVAVAVLGPRTALFVDAVTFAVSAVSIALLRWRPEPSTGEPPAAAQEHRRAAAPAASESLRPARTTPPAFAGLWKTLRVRRLLALCCLTGFFVVPEGLAVPFAASHGAGPGAAGILLAAGAIGGATGAVVVSKLIAPHRRAAAAQVMAMCCGIPLVFTAVTPGWPSAAVLWALSGTFAGYMVETTAAMVLAIPEECRARYVGIAGSLLLAAQGLGLLGFGLIAGATDAKTAVATAGVLGSVLAVVVVGRWRDAAYRPSHRAW